MILKITWQICRSLESKSWTESNRLDYCVKLVAWLMLYRSICNLNVIQTGEHALMIFRIFRGIKRRFWIKEKELLKLTLYNNIFHIATSFLSLFLSRLIHFGIVNWECLIIWKHEMHERGNSLRQHDQFNEKWTMKERIQPWHFNWNDNRNQ